MNNEINILSIDPSTVSTGYCLLRAEDIGAPPAMALDIIESGSIQTPKGDKDIENRNNYICSEMRRILVNILFDYHVIDVVVIERPFIGSNPKSGQDIAMLVGRFIEMANCRDLSYILEFPQTWRKTIGISKKGKSADIKKFTKALVEKSFDVKCKTHDESDAIAIAWAYAMTWIQARVSLSK